jgi:hypothetical protein
MKQTFYFLLFTFVPMIIIIFVLDITSPWLKENFVNVFLLGLGLIIVWTVFKYLIDSLTKK